MEPTSQMPSEDDYEYVKPGIFSPEEPTKMMKFTGAIILSLILLVTVVPLFIWFGRMTWGLALG